MVCGVKIHDKMNHVLFVDINNHVLYGVNEATGSGCRIFDAIPFGQPAHLPCAGTIRLGR
jgi:hypothetical protein